MSVKCYNASPIERIEGNILFHDELMSSEEERQRWHDIYRRLADAVVLSLSKFLEVWREIERSAHATGQNIHATTLMLLFQFAEAVDGLTILARQGSAKNCPQLLRTAFEIGLSVRYILKNVESYERRSLAYEYFHLADSLKWAQRCDPEHPIGKQLRKELEGDEFADLFDVAEKGADVKKEILHCEAKVHSSRYAAVRAEIKRIKELKKKAQKEKRLERARSHG